MVPLRIFTATQGQNTVSVPINGTVFVPGTEFVNSAIEQWNTYFPSLIYGGDAFMFFYKDGPNTPPPPPFNPPTPGGGGGTRTINVPAILVQGAFVDSEGLFDLSYFDWYCFKDRFHFSTFQGCFAACDDDASYPSLDPLEPLTSDEVLTRRGLSIPRRCVLDIYPLNFVRRE